VLGRVAAAAAIAALLVAGCGGSSRPEGPSPLIFVSVRDGDYAIFGAAADGKQAHRLTRERGDPSTPQGLFFQVEPAWSPDGRRIAFTSLRDGISHVYVMAADGTGTQRLTDSSQEDAHPTWSPDGTAIVFAREGALFRVPVAGGTARRVGRGPGNAADPASSPDGKLIAYDYRSPGSAVREVYVMSSDGTGIRRVTKIGGTSSFPAWSPDGRRLAFQSDPRLGHLEIYTIGLDGTGLHRVTRSEVDAIQPAWTPEGDVSYARDGAIWLSADGEETRLTSSEDIDSAPAWRPTRTE
jgi:TolB protein